MFGRSGSIPLMRILGIRLGVDVSWFFVLFLFIFILSGSFKDVLNSSDGVAYLTAVCAALLFFVSLVLHELGHALVARRLGIQILGIDLFFFGGIAKLARDTDSPGAEFKVAVAGPLVTLAIVGVCVAIGAGLGGTDEFRDAVALDASADLSPWIVLVGWLAVINALLFIFNIVPAFPLDGGRIMRSIVWKITGDRNRATRAAATLGQGFSYVLIGFGIFELLRGNVSGGLWSIVLGFFLGQAARGAVVQTNFTERLEGVTVADIMDREPVTIPGDIPLARAEDEWFLRYRWPWFAVVDDDGRFLGLVRQERVDGAVAAGDGHLRVRDIIDPDDGDRYVRQDDPLETLLGSESLRRFGALMAVDGEGRLSGVVTIDQVRRALRTATAR